MPPPTKTSSFTCFCTRVCLLNVPESGNVDVLTTDGYHVSNARTQSQWTLYHHMWVRPDRFFFFWLYQGSADEGAVSTCTCPGCVSQIQSPTEEFISLAPQTRDRIEKQDGLQMINYTDSPSEVSQYKLWMATSLSPLPSSI